MEAGGCGHYLVVEIGGFQASLDDGVVRELGSPTLYAACHMFRAGVVQSLALRWTGAYRFHRRIPEPDSPIPPACSIWTCQQTRQSSGRSLTHHRHWSTSTAMASWRSCLAPLWCVEGGGVLMALVEPGTLLNRARLGVLQSSQVAPGGVSLPHLSLLTPFLAGPQPPNPPPTRPARVSCMC